jgi:hypothetical protein
MCAWLAMLTVAMPDGARAQQPGSPDTTRADSLPSAAAIPTKPTLLTTPTPHSNSLTSFDDPEKEHRTYLPFASNPAPRTYPDVSLGVGSAYYASSFRGAEKAFEVVEDSIRRAGYDVPVTTNVHSGGIYVLALNVSASPRLGGTLQLGKTGDRNNEVRLVGGLVWGSWASPEARKLSLSAGLGGGLFRFRFNRSYGTIISPVDVNGGYTTLDYIRFEGGGAYATIAGRVAVEMSSSAAFAGTIQYLGMGDVSSVVAGAGRQSINVSGFILGLSFVGSF